MHEHWITDPMNQWNNESMNQWISESTRHSESMSQWISDTEWTMNQGCKESVNQGVIETMNQRIQLMNIESNTESMIQGISESMNQSLNQWIANQWANESVNQWFNKTNKINEPMIQRTNESNYATWIHESIEPMDQRRNVSMNQWSMKWTNEYEWMDGWMMTESDTICWLLLHWATLRWGISSLSYFFSEQPLLLTTSALNCLPAISSCSFCNPILVFAQPILCV